MPPINFFETHFYCCEFETVFVYCHLLKLLFQDLVSFSEVSSLEVKMFELCFDSTKVSGFDFSREAARLNCFKKQKI